MDFYLNIFFINDLHGAGNLHQREKERKKERKSVEGFEIGV